MGLIAFNMMLTTQQQSVAPPVETGWPALTIGSGHVEYIPAESWMSKDAGTSTERLYVSRLLHHNGKTYSLYQSRLDQLPNGQIRLIVFDNQKGFDVPVIIGNVLATSDTHTVPSAGFFVDPGDSVEKLYVVQENVHNTPLDRYKASNGDYSFFGEMSDIATNFAYANVVKDADGNAFIWGRGTTDWDNYLIKSTDGFEGFGSQIQVSDSPTGTTQRHYAGVPFGYQVADGFIHVWAANRKDDGAGGGIWYKFHKLKTPASGADRGVIWYNETETYSHDLGVDGVMDQTDYDTNFMFHQTDDDNAQGHMPCMGVSSTGRTYAICGDGDASYSFIFWDSGSIVKKPISLSGMETVDPAGQVGCFNYLMVISDDDIRVVVDMDVAGSIRPALWRTVDQGDSWVNLGDMCGDLTGAWQVFVPNNILQIAENENFALHFVRTDAVDTGAMLVRSKVAAWGNIQSIPGESVAAAASMDYNSTGLFHYRATEGNLTKTGNNVTAFVDLFGIRNGAVTNNAQWNTTDMVSFVAASSQRITHGTPASLVNKTAFTFIHVGRHTAAFTCICFSLNSDTDEYCEVRIIGTGEVYYRVFHGLGAASCVVMSQDLVHDGNKHVIGVRANGRSDVRIDIDGKLQYFETNLTSASSLGLWQQVGRGPAFVGANVVNAGFIDLSSGDAYTSGGVCEQLMYNGVMPEVEYKARIKKLCDDHSVTYQNQFKVPA